MVLSATFNAFIYIMVVGVEGGTFKRNQNIQRCGTYSRC